MTRQGTVLTRRGVLLASVLVAVLLALGCSTRSPDDDTTRYLLTDKPAVPDPKGGKRLLRVERIELARYLDSEGIVMQTSEVAIRTARHHLWAEDLAAQLHSDLRRRLAEQLDGVRVLGPDQRINAPDREVMELTVTVDRFLGRFDGYAVVGGQWEVLDSQGEVVAGKRFQREQALARDGYPALVESLKEGWVTVVTGIADGLRGAWSDAAAGR